MMDYPCTCGHTIEEHPGRKECDECPCIQYEEDDHVYYLAGDDPEVYKAMVEDGRVDLTKTVLRRRR